MRKRSEKLTKNTQITDDQRAVEGQWTGAFADCRAFQEFANWDHIERRTKSAPLFETTSDLSKSALLQKAISGHIWAYKAGVQIWTARVQAG
jgi:hypothetical protein